MEITDQQTANSYFEQCVQHCMRHGRSRVEAKEIERQNLGYYAGYYDDETRARVERLFGCSHPVFGPIATNKSPTPEAAFAAGIKAGRAK